MPGIFDTGKVGLLRLAFSSLTSFPYLNAKETLTMFRTHCRLLLVCLGVATLTSSPFSHNTCRADDSNPDTQAEVLQKFVSVSTQPAPDRIRLMQALPATDRSFLWRVHLALYVTQRPNLTKDQQSVVPESMNPLSDYNSEVCNFLSVRKRRRSFQCLGNNGARLRPCENI